jgi:hypothetical protein
MSRFLLMDSWIHRQTVVDRITAEVHEHREENDERGKISVPFMDFGPQHSDGVLDDPGSGPHA